MVFLMANAKAEWRAKMKRLLKAEGWKTIITSKDLRLALEVAMIVDMGLADKYTY